MALWWLAGSPLHSFSEENRLQLNAKACPLQSHSYSPDDLPPCPAVSRPLRACHPGSLGLLGKIQCNLHCAPTRSRRYREGERSQGVGGGG